MAAPDPLLYVLMILMFVALAIPLGRRRGRMQADHAKGAEAGLEFRAKFAASKGLQVPTEAELEAIARAQTPRAVNFPAAWQKGFRMGFLAAVRQVR